MAKIKIKVIQWGNRNLYSAYASVRGGSIETGNYKSASKAKCAFVLICNRLGIEKDRYEFIEKVEQA